MRDNMSENKDTYSDNDIINELEQCREDERNSQSQMIQVIMTAGTVLTLVFSAKFILEEHSSILFCLSCIVLCTTLGYITSLGISAVLRYHYIRDLEDKLSKCNEGNGIIHWNSFSSAITTRNLKHIHNIYTLMHYSSYTIAAVCPISFSIFLIYYQFYLIADKSIIDKLAMLISTFLMSLCLLIYFVGSVKAGKMYEKAMEISLKRRNERLNKTTVDTLPNRKRIRSAFKVIGYFIYPKKKDIQKLFLLGIGFFSGCLFRDNALTITNILGDLKNLCIVCLVIDILLYQARYQWNDIRGVREDVSSEKTDRLPVDILGERSAVIISSVLLLIKIIAAFVIILHLESDLKFILFVSAIIISGCAVLYEIVRSIENTWGIFLVVSFGYAIRFGVGMCSAYPEIWNQGFSFCNVTISRIIFVILLISYALLGEYSVILSWLQEVLMQKRDGLPINKKHYQFLYDRFVENCMGQEDIERFSINQSSALYELWNISYICAVSLLLLLQFVTELNFIIWSLEMLILILSVIGCITHIKNIKIYISILLGIYIIGILYSINNLHFFNLYIFITQLIFSYIYLYIKFLFNSSFDFVQKCFEIIKCIRQRILMPILRGCVILFIGGKTYSYLEEKLNGDGK